MDKWLDLVRGLVRPLVTVVLVGTLCGVVLRIVWPAKVPELATEVWVALISSFTTAVAVALAFWFAQRPNRSN